MIYVIQRTSGKTLGWMLKSIERFRKGELQYFDFVSELEDDLDVGEFDNEGLILKWYDYWAPLGILRAQNGNMTTVKDADKYLSDMESFLCNSLKRTLHKKS